MLPNWPKITRSLLQGCMSHDASTIEEHIHQVPQPTAVPPRKRPERPQSVKFSNLWKTLDKLPSFQKMWHQNESMVPKCDTNHVIESSCSHCLVVLLLSETSCGEQCCQVQRDKQFQPLWRWFLPGVPFLKWYYPNMNPLQHESTVVTLLPNPSQECFWKWPKNQRKIRQNEQKKRLHARSGLKLSLWPWPHLKSGAIFACLARSATWSE